MGEIAHHQPKAPTTQAFVDDQLWPALTDIGAIQAGCNILQEDGEASRVCESCRGLPLEELLLSDIKVKHTQENTGVCMYDARQAGGEFTLGTEGIRLVCVN